MIRFLLLKNCESPWKILCKISKLGSFLFWKILRISNRAWVFLLMLIIILYNQSLQLPYLSWSHYSHFALEAPHWPLWEPTQNLCHSVAATSIQWLTFWSFQKSDTQMWDVQILHAQSGKFKAGHQKTVFKKTLIKMTLVKSGTFKCRTSKCRTSKCQTSKCQTSKCQTSKCQLSKHQLFEVICCKCSTFSKSDVHSSQTSMLTLWDKPAISIVRGLAFHNSLIRKL